MNSFHVTPGIAMNKNQETIEDYNEMINDDHYKDLGAIGRIVGNFYGINPALLKKKTRITEIVFPRQVAMYFASYLTKHSDRNIGVFYGKKNHSTVFHAKTNTIPNYMDTNGMIKMQILYLEKRIKRYFKNITNKKFKINIDYNNNVIMIYVGKFFSVEMIGQLYDFIKDKDIGDYYKVEFYENMWSNRLQ